MNFGNRQSPIGSLLIPPNATSASPSWNSNLDSFSRTPSRSSQPLSRSPRATHTVSSSFRSGTRSAHTNSHTHGQTNEQPTSGSLIDGRVRLNVGGQLFVTYRSTLQRVPGSKLSTLDELDPSYDLMSGEYFFDRNATIFSSILDLYRTDELHFSHCLCGPAIKKELVFWGINEETIGNCCWRSYKTAEDEDNTAKMIEKALTEEPPTPKEDFRFGSLQQQLWSFVDKPLSSVPATVFIFS